MFIKESMTKESMTLSNTQVHEHQEFRPWVQMIVTIKVANLETGHLWLDCTYR